MTKQKPSIGRIVHTNCHADFPTAATITRVWHDECVNLQMHLDDSQLGARASRTSVSYFEAGPNGENLNDEGLPNMAPSDPSEVWWWPPRV